MANIEKIRKILDTIETQKSDLTLIIPNFHKNINYSSIIRSAHIFGVKEVYLVGRNTIPQSGATGTHKYTHIIHIPDYDKLFQLFSLNRIIAADVNGDIDITTFIWPKEPVLLLGDEKGFQESIIEQIQFRVKIPQYGICNSLNVGVAAGIMLFHHRTQFDIVSKL